jgi:hypothetical protein
MAVYVMTGISAELPCLSECSWIAVGIELTGF